MRVYVFGFWTHAKFRPSNNCQLDCQDDLELWIRCVRNTVLLLGIQEQCNPKPYGLLGSKFSKKFNIELGSDSTSLSLSGNSAGTQNKEYELSMRVKHAPAPFTRSRIVTFDAWYYLTNRTEGALHIRQANQHHWFCLMPLETRAFNFLRTRSDDDSEEDIAMEKRICIRWANYEHRKYEQTREELAQLDQLYIEAGGKWTIPLGISQIQESHVKMQGHVPEVLRVRRYIICFYVHVLCRFVMRILSNAAKLHNWKAMLL